MVFLTSSYFSPGTTETLSSDDIRVFYDDTSESHGLFTVVKSNGKCVIQANHAGRVGEGTLIVRVHNVYNVRVAINVVGFSTLELWAIPYPSVEPTYRILTIKRVANISGAFQQAALRLRLVLTDNSTFDVSTTNLTSYHLVQNDLEITASIGPSPFNLLRIARSSGYGKLSVCGVFAGRRSRNVNLLVSQEVLIVKQILNAQLNGLVNQTLVGLAGKATAQLQVFFLMNDSSLMAVRNFSIYPGLVTFTVDHPEIVSVDYVTGRVTLIRDYYDVIRVTVTAMNNAGESVNVQFFCNTEPPVGGVDVGQRFGPAIPYLALNQKVKIPLRMNAGASKLLAFDVKISYDTSKAIFLGVNDDTPYLHKAGLLHLANVIDPDALSRDSILFLVFESRQVGVLNVQITSTMLIDNMLHFIGTSPPPGTPAACALRPLGDVNMDCVFDVRDAAYTLLYSLASEHTFHNNIGHHFSSEATSEMVSLNSRGVHSYSVFI